MAKKILGERMEKAEPTLAEKTLNQLKDMGTAHYFGQDAQLVQEADIFLTKGGAVFCLLLIKKFQAEDAEKQAQIEKDFAKEMRKKK